VRSLAYVLSMYPGVKMYFVAPDIVRMKDDIKEYLTSVGVDWEEVDDLKVRSGDRKNPSCVAGARLWLPPSQCAFLQFDAFPIPSRKSSSVLSFSPVLILASFFLPFPGGSR